MTDNNVRIHLEPTPRHALYTMQRSRRSCGPAWFLKPICRPFFFRSVSVFLCLSYHPVYFLVFILVSIFFRGIFHRCPISVLRHCWSSMRLPFYIISFMRIALSLNCCRVVFCHFAASRLVHAVVISYVVLVATYSDAYCVFVSCFAC